LLIYRHVFPGALVIDDDSLGRDPFSVLFPTWMACCRPPSKPSFFPGSPFVDSGKPPWLKRSSTTENAPRTSALLQRHNSNMNRFEFRRIDDFIVLKVGYSCV
jgi:hypothetical protein